ncbi:YraN family protein [bacterium]|nr:YraN family protein [bacterium]
MESSEIGKRGEYLAKNYLIKNNYKILDQNFFLKTSNNKVIAEIDIIAKNKSTYCFIEVKSSYANSSSPYFCLEKRVHRKKARKIILAAKYWLKNQKIDNVKWQIDILGVLFYNNNIDFIHLTNVFEDNQF